MPRSVLLVDDTAFLRSMLREILEQSGAYRVVAEASDGTAALTLAPEIRPDLIITDLIMPSLDGVELTRALTRMEPSPRIIVAASADQEGAVLNALAAGGSDFITKPYSVLEVLRTLGGTPPAPPPREETPKDLLLQIALMEDTPLPRARIRVLRSLVARIGELLEQEGEVEAMFAADAPATLQLTLRTRLSSEDARGWVGRLTGVADVIVSPALTREHGVSEKLPSRSASALNGSLRVKASLLDRLLDHLEQMATDRQEVVRHLLPTNGSADHAALDPILRRIDRGISRMRAEIFAARLVPFDRIASRLLRCTEEAAKGSSRRLLLRIQGGDARLDLALLEEVGEVLESLLPGIVEAAVGRVDILRQLGRPEEAELLLAVTRNAQRLCLTLQLPESADKPAVAAMDRRLQESMAKLGGSAALSTDNGCWKLEMILPAGVSLVRSYLCQAGKHLFAIPVASVERAVELAASHIRISDGKSFWQEDGNEPMPLVRFPRIPWAQADGTSRTGFPGLVYRVGPQRYALAVDAVLGETDVVLRPLKEAGSGGQVAGMALMPDGGIAVIPDLPNLARTR